LQSDLSVSLFLTAKFHWLCCHGADLILLFSINFTVIKLF